MAGFKFFVVLVVVLGVSMWNCEAFTDDILKHGQQLIKFGGECKESVGATEEDMKMLMAKKIPTTTTGTCMMACMMEKLNVLVDGKYHSEASSKMAHEILGDDCEVAHLIGEVSKHCEKAVMAGDDKCTTAKNLVQCKMDTVEKFREYLKTL